MYICFTIIVQSKMLSCLQKVMLPLAFNNEYKNGKKTELRCFRSSSCNKCKRATSFLAQELNDKFRACMSKRISFALKSAMEIWWKLAMERVTVSSDGKLPCQSGDKEGKQGKRCVFKC